MFNFANIIKAVVTIAAVANTVIRKVAEKNPVVANVVKTFDNFVSSFTRGGGSSGGSSSGKGGDGGSGGLSAAERQRREEERKQRELDRRASAFDDDIARKLSDQRPDVEVDGDGGGNQAVPSLRDLAAMTGLDLDRWMQGEPMTAALTILTATNPVAFTMFQLLRHEPGLWKGVRGSTNSDEEAVVALCGIAEAGSEEVAECVQAISIANQYAYAGDDFGLLLQDQPAQEQADDDPCSQYPGWSNVGGFCEPVNSERSLWDIKRSNQQLSPQELEQEWLKLSPLEREIEIALANTSSPEVAERAKFNNVMSVDEILTWFDDPENRDRLNEAAKRFEVDPVLLAGVLASEMAYDFDGTDQFLSHWREEISEVQWRS